MASVPCFPEKIILPTVQPTLLPNETHQLDSPFFLHHQEGKKNNHFSIAERLRFTRNELTKKSNYFFFLRSRSPVDCVPLLPCHCLFLLLLCTHVEKVFFHIT